MDRTTPQTEPPPPEDDVRRPQAGDRAGLGLLVVAALTVAGWLPLQRWYSLPDNRDNTHFAFEKVPGQFSSPVLRGTLALFLALAVLHLLGWWLLGRSAVPSRTAHLAVVAMVVGPGLANILTYPVGALDVFNYLIEMKLTWVFHQNPYLVTFAGYRDDPFALPAFLVDVPLFYGPAWLAASGIPALLVGFGDILRLLVGLKVVNLLLIGGIGVALHRHHRACRAGWTAAYLFAANPLVLFEGVGNGHNDVLMTALLVAALIAATRRSVLTGPALALSALVKFFTAVLGPLFLARAIRDRWRWRAAETAVAAAAVAALVALPWWSGGAMVDGLREGTVVSQRMNHVSPLSLGQQWARTHDLPAVLEVAPASASSVTACAGRAPDGLLPLPTLDGHCPPAWLSPNDRAEIVRSLCAGLFVVLAIGVAAATLRGRSLEAGAVDTLLLFALLMTNLFPWYLIPVIAVVALRPTRATLTWTFAATALGLAYYPAYVWARFNSGYDEWHRHLFLALFLTVPILLLLCWEAVAPAVAAARRRIAVLPMPNRSPEAH